MPIIQHMHGQEGSHIPWHMVLDYMASSKALLSADDVVLLLLLEEYLQGIYNTVILLI